MYLTWLAGELTAVDTALLQAVRTLFVWIINLLIWAVAAALTPDTADQAKLANSSTAGIASIARGSHSSPLTLQHDVGSVLQAQQQQQQWGRDWGGVDPAAMAAAADLSAAAGVLPGEPWVRWSFLQAAGFIILVVGE